MINSEISTIDLGTNVGSNPTFHKQPILAAKKVALRDVQNNNRNLTPDPHPLLPVDGQTFMDTAKTVGLKRPTPDYVPPPLLTNNGSLDHFSYTRRKYELGRNVGTEKITDYPRPHVQQEINKMNGKNIHYRSVVAPNQMGSKTSVPRFKESGDEHRADRFIRLQNFIKQCDGSNHRDNIQSLLRLSPSELSRHAVELEKRAIQLTIEEGKEMQRMQALNILGKPSTTRNAMPITQQVQHKN